ncbi:unnamed protein product, partial [Mesorhabditis belari]|uniref:Uncharacterized protein n=1 Tax=Mesorhabditis belari TaxID=2138241 RepID=A0AAF3J4W2_9BILA
MEWDFEVRDLSWDTASAIFDQCQQREPFKIYRAWRNCAQCCSQRRVESQRKRTNRCRGVSLQQHQGSFHDVISFLGIFSGITLYIASIWTLFTDNNEAIITGDDVQMVVVDSPGTIGLGHAKEMMRKSGQDRILSDPEKAITRSQHILVVQDATATGDYIHHRVLQLLHRHCYIPSSLVFNKKHYRKPSQARGFNLSEIILSGRKGVSNGRECSHNKNTTGATNCSRCSLRERAMGKINHRKKWRFPNG